MSTATKETVAPIETQIQRQFLQARYKSVPLVMIRTADPGATVSAIAKVSATDKGSEAAVIQWDQSRGYREVNPLGKPFVDQVKACINAVQALEKAELAPRHAVIAMYLPLPETVWRDMAFVQAVWNLRDIFKRDWRTLVLLVPSGSVPTALEHDVLVIDEPLPGPDHLRQIVKNTFKAAGFAEKDTPDDKALVRIVDGVAGLSAFAAEQAIALSLKKSGIDHVALRDRHRQMITNTKGLSVWTGGETFKDIGGQANFKAFAQRVIDGTYRFGAVAWIDEIEKAFGGLRGDLTGISQDYLGVLLGYMADKRVPGILLMGHPGTGKSADAKAFGNTAGVPTIRMDLQAMHGSLVGESQHALRHALKVVSAVSQDRPMFLATCNSVAVLPPEFVNRFKWRFFVDMPDDEEKATIWPIHLKAYNIPANATRPDDTGWNGREIEQCCATAAQLKCSLVEAAQYVVPISVSSAEEIEKRRQEANGRYLSASQSGMFLHEPRKSVTVGNVERQIKLSDGPAILVPGPKDAQ